MANGMTLTVSDLISIISAASDRYGSKLLDFMERYHVARLADATQEQLYEYVTAERLSRKGEKTS